MSKVCETIDDRMAAFLRAQTLLKIPPVEASGQESRTVRRE